MFKSIQFRLVLIFIVVAVALIMPVGLVLNNRVASIYYENFMDAVESGFRNWQVNEGSDLEYMLNAMSLFSLDEYKSYTVFDSANVDNIVHSSDSVYDAYGKSRFLSEALLSRNLLAVLAGQGEARDSRQVVVGGERYYDYARLIRLSDAQVILYFRYNSRAWAALTSAFSQAILLTSLLAVLIASVSGFVLARTITKPIQTLMESANSIANGDFDHLAEVKSDDEIGKLASASNTMARALKHNLEEITSEKNKQENILNYSKDGIVAYSMAGDVILSNPAAAEVLGAEAVFEPFDAFAVRFGMGRTVAGIAEARQIVNWETTADFGEKALEIYCAVFSDITGRPGGVIAVIHDVTEQRRLENMRREFVANVSHELRTPLTSIISYSETLLEGGAGDPETAGRFLTVIHSEADRMARLVRELLQLSRYDSHQARWSFQWLDINAVVKGCVDRMQIAAEEKGQRMAFYAFGAAPRIRADKDKLDQVFINIISNAIKYTPDGGSIAVYVSRMADEVHVKVSDTGIGVPAKDIPRLTERFFRVDKARSRDMGGTGLGLAIANEIVQGHQGSIQINSRLGQGTDVIVRLPINPE